jgi:outer membrane protein, multidrug efflux system
MMFYGSSILPALTALSAGLVLAGCAAPALQQPQVDVPAAFREAAVPHEPTQAGSWKPALPADAQPRGEWWKVFNDAALDRLIDEASSADPRLAQGAARVKQARAIT